MRTNTLTAVGATPDNEQSIESLYRAHGTWLVRVARMFVDDRAAAEDLVQEAFIRFHRNRHRLRDTAAAAGYLRSTVLNLARDHNRRGMMSLRHVDSHPMGTMGPDPDDALVIDDEQRTVIAAVAKLSLRQRDCIVMRYYLELSYEEIGVALAISPNSVKTHLKRGMASLRQQMEGRE